MRHDARRVDDVFDETLLDDPRALDPVDPDLRDIAGWGAEVRRAASTAADALARLAAEDGSDQPRAVIAAGPDGRLFRAVLEPVCPVPFVAWSHAGLPGWAGPLDLVVVMSTSGHDPAALSVVNEASRRGCRRLVLTPAHSPLAEAAANRSTTVVPAGSADPLALAVPALQGLHTLRLGPEVDPEPVANALDRVAIECAASRPLGDNPAKELAVGLADAVPVVWGGSVLAARAARRVAEALRARSGRPALAGEATQLEPMLSGAPEVDIFADPYEAEPVLRPALVILDDGAETPMDQEARRRLLAIADARHIHVQTIAATEGPSIGRFAALLATGRFAAIYLAVGLGRTLG